MANSGLQQLFEESVSAVTATNSVQLGTVRYENGRRYQYVYNNGTTAISPGYGCIISALTGYSVTISSTTEVKLCFGVVYHNTLTTATYGWVVKDGFVPVQCTASTGLAVGDSLVLGDDGVATRITLITGYTNFPVYTYGYVVQATASGGSGYALVHCFG